MTGHRIELSLDTDSGVSANFVCDEPAYNWCHQSCTYGCEIEDDDCAANHPHETVEYCNCVEFVNNGGMWWEQYIGEETEPRSGAIAFEWQDDWYGWRYEDVMAPATPTTLQGKPWVDPFEYETVRQSKPRWWNRLKKGNNERQHKPRTGSQ